MLRFRSSACVLFQTLWQIQNVFIGYFFCISKTRSSDTNYKILCLVLLVTFFFCLILKVNPERRVLSLGFYFQLRPEMEKYDSLFKYDLTSKHSEIHAAQISCLITQEREGKFSMKKCFDTLPEKRVECHARI